MTSRRVLKAAEAIREVVSMAILVELRDPRIENVTVTYVEVSADMRHAQVNVSVMADEKKQRLCLDALQKASGFLQRKINDRIETRYTPKLSFKLDQGVKNSIEISRILSEVLPDKSPEPDDSSEPVSSNPPPENKQPEITDSSPALADEKTTANASNASDESNAT